jgi:oligopeptide/dipeptide ABC transporter ATP-binding protein
MAVLGESGSGKSTLALAIAGLLPAKRSSTFGSVRLNGQELIGLPASALQEIRGRSLSLIFQDPLSSLNPVKRVGDQVGDLFVRHRGLSKKQARYAAVDVLKRVQIPHAAERAGDYPHQFSGGMRQRVMIAIALALEPLLVIADEPTTALDVTIQAQIIELLEQLRDEAGTALILITHDLGVAAALAERLVVMYAGRIVEEGPLADVYEEPLHPYTTSLLASAPQIAGERLVPIPGAPPSLLELPSGCRFHPRCFQVAPICSESDPPLRVVETDRQSACFFAERLLGSGVGPAESVGGSARA